MRSSIALKGQKTTDGGDSPGNGHPTNQALKGRKSSFVPSALRMAGTYKTGGITPACNLVSLSGFYHRFVFDESKCVL